MAKKVASEIRKDSDIEIMSPIDLGSSWVPPKRKEKIKYPMVKTISEIDEIEKDHEAERVPGASL